jgi:type IV pilus assembly protein PilA
MRAVLPTITCSDRRGFTLIELLIVVVIIGILAAIAIPKFASTKERAFLVSMKADLRNLATLEESYLFNSGVYLAGTASNVAGVATELDATSHFVPSAGVTVTVTIASPVGWSATASHTGTGKQCYIFMQAPPLGVATVDGEPRCDP